MKCPICDSRNLRFLFSAKDRLIGSLGEYDIRFCETCRIGMTQVETDDKYFETAYPTEYYTEVMGLDGSIKDRTLQLEVILEVTQIDRKSVLEVGCADGSLLTALKEQGAHVVGVEPNGFVAEMARTHGLTIYDDMAGVGDDRFDLIILYGTLEHLPDPVDQLRRFRRHMTEGGVLILDVPNLASLEAKLLRSMWFGLEVPMHLFHYTPGAVEKLANKAGLRATPIQTKRRASFFVKSLVDPRLKNKSSWQKTLDRSPVVVRGLRSVERLLAWLGDRPLMFYKLIPKQRAASIAPHVTL